MARPELIRSRAAMRRENRSLARAHRPQWPTAVVSAVLGGALALSGTYFGAREERARESREKRAQLYADYLAVARSYLTAGVTQQALQHQYAAAAKKGTRGPRYQEELAAAAKRLDQINQVYAAAQPDFQKQADLLFVYGSDNAWQAHDEVVASINELSRAGIRQPQVSAGERGNRALRQFQVVFCREAPAEPRKGCDS
jgi:hypothetical protein